MPKTEFAARLLAPIMDKVWAVTEFSTLSSEDRSPKIMAEALAGFVNAFVTALDAEDPSAQ